MTIFFTQISRAGAKKICKAPGNFLNIPKPFSQIKRSLRLAAALLSFGLFAASASGQVTITTPGATTLNAPGVINYLVTFSTAQTGVSASNFTITGTSTTPFDIVVSGSGTSYAVGLTVSGNARSSGTVILNMVNSTGLSPGVGGLPVSGPAIQVNYPAPSATLTLTSTNANPGFAKTGDQLNYTLTTNGYNINYAIINAGGNQVYNSGTQLPSTSGSLTLGSGTPQGAIVYNFTCDYTIGETAGVFGGNGTSAIVFDSQPPTASISAPSFTTVGNNGTSSVSYNINYTDANFGSSNLTASGITLNTTGTASGTVSVTGSGASYVVTISHILGAGTLGISVAGGYATDLAGNTDTGAGPSQTVNLSGDIVPAISSVTPASGPVGTLVTITGTNLATPTALTIGGVPAIVISDDGSTLVGMVMPGAVAGPVSFTNNGGNATGAGNFVVTPTLYPSLQQGPKLVGTGSVGNAEQGITVAVSADGNTAIVGGNFDNSSHGAAWVYTRSGGMWTQQGSKLLGNDAVGSATNQGISVAISADGNTAIVGGFGDNNNQGAAWVYTRSGGTWTQQGPKLVGTGVVGSYGAAQGYSVAISADGNTAAVGGYYDNSGVGAVWVYTRSGGTWTQQGAKLVGTGSAGSNVFQGWSVSLSADGNTLIAGGDADNSNQGAAWVYTRGGGVWTQQGAKLVGTGFVGNSTQGFSVSLSADGNTAIVGGKGDNTSVGAAWVYTRSGGVWSQQGSKLVGTGAVGNAEQGVSVSLTADGNTAMVGGWFDNNDQGASWVYTRSGGVWTQQGAKLVGTGGAGSYSEQGSSVSLSADGNTAIAGGFGDNNSLGAAWAYISLQAPTMQAGSVTFTNTGTLTTTASWTNGNGSSRAVFMYAGSSGSPAPVNNTAYKANAAFGTGDQVGSTGWYCVYNGTGSTVNISGLSIGTTYQLMVVEYNGSGSNVKYLTTAGTGNPAAVTTLPPQPPTIAGFSPASGAVGTLVTISGTNLIAATSLTIGGVQAIIISNTDNALVGMIMPGAATGPVSMTSAGGAASSSSNFKVTATLYPSLQQGSKLVGTGNAGSYSAQGNSVAVSADGNTAIVGGASDNSNVGAVWIYIRSGGVWIQQGPKLVDNNNIGPYGSIQGNSVAISADGNTALAGGYNASGAGAVWVYTRSGGTWTQQGSPLVGTNALAGSYSGASVSLSADGNTAIAGDFGGYSYYHGAAWIYTRSGGIWTQQGPKLVFTDAAVNSGQGSSVSLSADGNTAIVGGYADNSNQGAAWVFSRSGAVWTQQGSKLVGTGAVGSAYMGYSVSLSADGNTAIIGGQHDNNGRGAAWVYTRSGGLWTQQGLKLVGKSAVGFAGQGASVSLSADGNTAMIGGEYDNSNQGAAWVFTRSNGLWTMRGSKLVGTDATAGAYIGAVSLSADGNTAIAGGQGDNNGLGAAWAYISLQAPTTHAGNVTFTGTTASATTASWTNGNGSSRAVFMLAGSSGNPAPVNNTAYNANAAFGSGDQVGSTGWYCIYNGTGNTVNITGLTAGTIYQVMVVEYNGSGISIKYLTTQSAGNPASVTTLSANANLIGLNISSGTITPAFTTATTSYTASVDNSITALTVTPATVDPNATVKVNGVTVASGTASASISLNIGVNTFTTVVTAQDGVTTKTYTITVTRAPSTNAGLSSLALSSGTLSPAFATGTTSYTASVGSNVASVTVTPTTSDGNAKVTVNGTAVNTGSASGAIPLIIGTNTITTVVTAQDGVTTKTYTVAVTRPASNANLVSLGISSGTLTPAFATATTGYTAAVGNTVSTIKMTPKSSNGSARITVNGTTVASGTASGSIPLNVGPNTITTIVTAQDGITTKTYTLTVTRAPSNIADLSKLSLSTGTLAPVFAAATTSYTASVGNGITSITATPVTSDATATVTVNGTGVSSGTASGSIALNVGPNTITTIVTAQDGVTTKTYTITVTRALPANANLAALTTSAGALSPAFNAGTASYTASVANSVTSVTVTPKSADGLATITVNGAAVSSGKASGAIPLNVGANVISTIVTAENGTTTQTYTITVSRAATIANLAAVISVSNPTGHPQMMGEEIVVHQGLSPNGDGINDFLMIDGITNYPDNKLMIMNRSGQLVFEAKGYDNSTRVFDGHSNKNGAMQLPGTYFYSLDFTANGVTKHKTGFIILKY